MSRYSRKPAVKPVPAIAKPKEPVFPEGRAIVTHANKPGWVGYIYEIPWNLTGHADVMWVVSPIDPKTEKPEPLPIFPQRYPLASLIEQSTPKTEGVISGKIWGQEDGLKGDRLYPHPQDASRGKNQGLPEDEDTGELIRVVNVHAIAGKQLPNLIVAMQSKGHPLGNPYYREAKSDRAGCIRKFKKWLWQQYQIEDSPQRKAVEAIVSLALAGEQVNLACCCFPAQCHCDEVKALAEWAIAQRLEVAA